MVVQAEEDTSLGKVNTPQETCITDEGIPGFRNSRQNAESADKSPDESKAAAKKKLDEIVSCPRFNSMEAKFCYLKDHNVNQPSYLCRSCQQYWTPGVASKSLPIGAGCCKSKHASSFLQPVTILSSDELTREEPGKLLEASSAACRERARVLSSKFSLMSKNEVSHTVKGFPDPPYPRNLFRNGKALLAPWNSPTTGMIPGVCIPNIIIPLVPRNSGCSGDTSPSLRKHSRDPKSQDEKKTDKCLCLPKTLRIVDPEEVAKSSIWSTLGIKHGKTDPIRNGCMFRAFQFWPEANAETSEVDKALESNPIAHSRSQIFHESI